ncbi:MAG TPA: sigma-70 family RNA polymerase sigma factor [Actinomycetota bacterium]
MEACRSSDRKPFETLYQRYRGRIFGLCYKHVRDPHVAEDMVQETFYRAYINFEDFDASKPAWPWLATIATRLCIDAHRTGKRVAAPVEDVDVELDTDRRRISLDDSDPTVDAISRRDQRTRLGKAIASLPARQSRPLLLYALDGWNLTDIASAEGVSVGCVKSLMFRARASLRKMSSEGAFGVLFGPLVALTRRFRMAGTRFAADGARAADGAAASWSLVACALGLVLAFGQVAPGPAGGPELEARAGEPAAASTSRVTGLDVRSVTPESSFTKNPAHGIPGLLDPTKDAGPEDTRFSSFAVQEDESGTVIYASGNVPCVRTTCPTLFVSRDEGASWRRVDAPGFPGGRLLLAPNSERMFVMAATGFYERRDNGAFELVSPITGGAAVAPETGERDAAILLGGPTVFEYSPEDGVVMPSQFAAVSRGWSEIAVVPGATDTILVGGARPGVGSLGQSVVYRCEATLCTEALLPGGEDVPWLRVASDAGGITYAFTSYALYSSPDDGRSFATVNVPQGASRPMDLASGHGVTYLATVKTERSAGGLYVSPDEGRSWNRLSVDLAYFDQGVSHVTILPSGTLLITPAGDTGLACSVDGGQSWAPRCAA